MIDLGKDSRDPRIQEKYKNNIQMQELILTASI